MITAFSDQPLALRLGLMLLPLLLAAGFAAVLRRAEREDAIARRLSGVMHGSRAGQQQISVRLLLGVAQFGRLVASSGVLSGKALDGMRNQLSAAGIRGSNAVGVFIGVKLILAAGLPALAAVSLEPGGSVLMHRTIIVASAALGLLVPDFGLKFLSRRYSRALEAGLPDMLDMLVMCTESGFSLEPAIARVATEIAQIHPTMSAELALTSGELHIMTDARAAFTNLGRRTGLRGLTRLASTLSQTLQYGTPLAPALRSLTAEMRQEMLTKFEERAGRLPSLLTVVMILFILPSLFMAVGGPAALQLMQQFRN